MPFVLTYPNINGHRFQPASCEITIAGLRIIGIGELNYDDSLEPGELRGTTPYLIGTTAGIYKASGDMTMPELEWAILMAKLGPGYGEVRHLIQVMMFEPGTQASKHELVGTRIKKVGNAIKTDSADGLMVKLELHPMYILRNGLALAQPRGVAL